MIRRIVFNSIVMMLLSASLFAQEQKTMEDKAGVKTFEMVKNTYGIYTNEALLQEVTSIGRQLEKQLPFPKPLTYFLVDTPEPNAFATMGGYVYVTRGLLSIVNTRDELAGVMAHELSHVVKHHPRKKLEVVIIPALLKLPANVIGALTDPQVGNLLNMPIELPSNLGIAAFSRSQEKAADISGVDIASKAGFDPYGLVIALERLDVYVEYITKEKMQKTANIDHPMTVDRVAYLTEYLQKKGYQRGISVSGTTILAIDNLLYGQNPKYGVAQSNLYTHPLIKYQVQFPKDWQMQVTNQSVVSISKDQKHCIALSCDSSSTTIEALAKQARSKINTSYNVTIDSSSINGLKAIRMAVYIESKAKNCEMLWVQLPGKKYILKFISVYDVGQDNKAILACFNSTRSITHTDLEKIYYKTIDLKKEVNDQKMRAYITSNDTTEIGVLCVLNNIQPEDVVKNEGKYVKVFNRIPLILYKE